MDLASLSSAEFQVYIAAFSESAVRFADSGGAHHATIAEEAVRLFREVHPKPKRVRRTPPVGYVNRVEVLNKCVQIVRAHIAPGVARDQIVREIVRIKAPKK